MYVHSIIECDTEYGGGCMKSVWRWPVTMTSVQPIYPMFSRVFPLIQPEIIYCPPPPPPLVLPKGEADKIDSIVSVLYL